MSGSTEMLVAYRDHLVSPAAREMIGWRDSDSDGILDGLRDEIAELVVQRVALGGAERAVRRLDGQLALAHAEVDGQAGRACRRR